MKIARITLGVASLVTISNADPVKWADGRITEAIGWKAQPRIVELKTDKGIERVEAYKLDPTWLKEKFPDDDLISLQAKVEAIDRALEEIRIDPPDPAIIENALKRYQAQVDALEAENAKLKAELKKLQRK